ncbi:MAG: DUF5916 domain-containing protein [Longimicrobiales bacterium]
MSATRRFVPALPGHSAISGLAALAAWTLLAFAAPAPLAAQNQERPEPRTATTAIDVEAAPRPEVRATRAAGPIEVDGVLDEASWAAAPVIDRFTQSRPDRGMPLTEATEVRILYDDETLYVGVEMWDRSPDRLTIPSLEQDFESGNSDIFGITLDTFLDRRNAFMFLVNPMGAVKEAQDFDDSRYENAAWEGIFDVKTRVHDRGWTIEWAIPFTTVRFDPGQDVQDWGMQLMRRIRRNNEEGYWAPLDQRDRIHKMSKAGTLRGLQGIRSGRNLLVKPYVMSARAQPGADPTDWTADGGLDVKYGITPRMTLDLTWRTDFSQVEVDQEQVNLTRFSLFFPERRDFFTENSGVFNFGDIGERNYRSGSSLRDFTLFHSRRIGLQNGQEVPIVGGGRLTGRAAGLEVGAISMQTRSALGLPEENFSVLRAKRTIEGFGDIGAILVNRQSTDGAGTYNRTGGVEANLAPSRYLRINSYLATVDDSQLSGGSAWAGRLWAGWRDNFWNVSAGVKHVGDAFVPRVGFVRRGGVRNGYATVGVHHRPAAPWLNEINPFVEVDYVSDLNGRLLTRVRTASLDVGFRDGSSFGADVIDNFERLDDPFSVLADAVVPAGDYTFREVGLSAGTSAGRALSGRARVSTGGFFNGDRTALSLSGQWRANYRLSLDGSAQRNKISIPGAQDFDADVYGGRLTYGASTTLFASAFVQYNSATEDLVTNLRLNYIHAPLSDLFIVYTERRNQAGLRPLERLLSFKVTKALAF